MRLSIASSLYRSEASVEEFVRRCASAAATVTDDIEVVLVDDGSPDSSGQIARQLTLPGVKIRVITLARNFGQLPALMTALRHTTGDVVFLLDSDLEEPPECLGEMWAALQENPDSDIVYGIRAAEGSAPTRRTSDAFFSLFNRISAIEVPRHQTQMKLMTRRFVDALLSHPEHEIYLAGLVANTGFHHVTVDVPKSFKGESSYTRLGRLRLGLEAVAGFSDRPLSIILGLGAALAAAALLAAVALIIAAVTGGADYAPGWLSIITAITFFSGLIIATLGVIGFYIGRIFVEVKARPVIIRDVHVSTPDITDNGR